MTGQINFWSGKNYMKRDPSSNSTSIAAPTVAYDGNYITRLYVPHTLGKVPFFRVSYQPFQDGVIYPAQGSRNSGSILKIDGSGTAGPYLLVNPTSTELYIELGYFSNTLTGTFPIYYVIYQDYSL